MSKKIDVPTAVSFNKLQNSQTNEEDFVQIKNQIRNFNCGFGFWVKKFGEIGRIRIAIHKENISWSLSCIVPFMKHKQIINFQKQIWLILLEKLLVHQI